MGGRRKRWDVTTAGHIWCGIGSIVCMSTQPDCNKGMHAVSLTRRTERAQESDTCAKRRNTPSTAVRRHPLVARETCATDGPAGRVPFPWTLWLVGLGISAVIVLCMVPLPTDIPAAVLRPAVLSVFAMLCWATGVLPEHVTALAFFALAMLLAIAPPEVVFAGFLSASLWLVLSGLIVGVAIIQTGLGAWVAQAVLGWCGTSYVRLVSGLVVMGMTLTFVMPSTIGRTLLVIPLVVALAERLGFAAGTPGRTGLVMAAALGTYMPAAAILPANIPNLALAGASETLYGLTFHYGSYLLWHLPVTGVLKAIAMVLLICRMYPATMRRPERVHAPPPLTRDQHVLLAVLLVALGCWMSDAFHHLAPAWVGLGVALLCVLPRRGSGI